MSRPATTQIFETIVEAMQEGFNLMQKQIDELKARNNIEIVDEVDLTKTYSENTLGRMRNGLFIFQNGKWWTVANGIHSIRTAHVGDDDKIEIKVEMSSGDKKSFFVEFSDAGYEYVD